MATILNNSNSAFYNSKKFIVRVKEVHVTHLYMATVRNGNRFPATVSSG